MKNQIVYPGHADSIACELVIMAWIMSAYHCPDVNMDKSLKAKVKLIVEMVNESDISSIKKVITEILKIILDDSSSARDLKFIIELDPPLCARLLKRANSSYYGYPRTISDIQEAIVCIGFDAVKELALTQKVCELFAKEDNINGYSRLSLWKHSLAVAISSKMIYRREFRERGENLYIAGLLHDIGIIVEDQFFQRQFKKVLGKMNEEKINMYAAEEELLIIDHARIGQAIAEDWNFPEELSMAIGFHHRPDEVGKEFERIVATVFVADYICQREDIGFADMPFRNASLFHECLGRLGVKEEAVDIIAQELKEEIIKMEKLGWFYQ